MRTNCRPKHQTLILRCYPKVLKNAVDVKANPSELSYLLFYVSNRRSKLQKVGEFLTRRAAKDVWRKRVGNIQVTLEICRSLIEKCPRDLNLYASSILTILTTVVKSKDISLIEESLPCLEAFCAHHDGANLASDEAYVKQFEDVIRLYADCAGSPVAGQELRWRSVGLKAVKSIASSEALSSFDAKRQLAIIIPVVLKNVYSEDEDHLDELQHRVTNVDHGDGTSPLQMRMSIGTIDGAMANTAADADMLEQQDIELLALQSLKRIFEVNNLGQIRFATAALVHYVSNREAVAESWMTALIEMVARWTQVQYRFLILVEVMETLVAAPMQESALPRQLILAQLISWLLSSTVNLVGLSVMDVLLSIIAKIQQLLQLEHKGSGSESPAQVPVPSNTTAAIFHMTSTITEVAKSPSNARKELLNKLKGCIADLATHIYYTDQISDICSELLMRLKPSPNTPLTTDPAVAAAATGSLTEQVDVDDFFSFDTARAVALQAVKELLVVANQKNQSGVGRNTVPLSVWEGTPWLLRDEEKAVRTSYIAAFCTYLRLELDRPDSPSAIAATVVEVNNLKITPRASKLLNSSFMKLLHIAIYETVLAQAGNTSDMVAILDLLTTLVRKLGLPALVSGIPMIYKLQDDAERLIADRRARLMVMTLVAVYLYTVTETLELEDLRHDMMDIISDRKDQGQWFRGLVLPSSDAQNASADAYVDEKMPYTNEKPILPITNRPQLVDEFCAAYAPDQEFPPKVREQLLTEWSKDAILLDIETRGSRQTSLVESRQQNRTTMRSSYLTVNGATPTGHLHRSPSRPATAHTNNNKTKSMRSKSATRSNSSSRESYTVRAAELKQVLSSGGGTVRRQNRPATGITLHDDGRSESSGSPVEYMSSSEDGSPSPPMTRLLLSQQRNQIDEEEEREYRHPPMPKLPNMDLSMPGNFPDRELSPLPGTGNTYSGLHNGGDGGAGGLIPQIKAALSGQNDFKEFTFWDETPTQQTTLNPSASKLHYDTTTAAAASDGDEKTWWEQHNTPSHDNSTTSYANTSNGNLNIASELRSMNEGNGGAGGGGGGGGKVHRSMSRSTRDGGGGGVDIKSLLSGIQTTPKKETEKVGGGVFRPPY